MYYNDLQITVHNSIRTLYTKTNDRRLRDVLKKRFTIYIRMEILPYCRYAARHHNICYTVGMRYVYTRCTARDEFTLKYLNIKKNLRA